MGDTLEKMGDYILNKKLEKHFEEIRELKRKLREDKLKIKQIWT